MKRSEINAIMEEAIGFINKMNFKLPPFAYFSPEDWAKKGDEYREIRENQLGWDITDFGSGDFEKIGLFLFTLRNGSLSKPQGKPYAEKLLIAKPNQVTPYHFHFQKMEDIINRGGGDLCVKLYNSTESEELADTVVTASVDGRNFEVPAGTIIRLTPGESITLPAGMYHSFWGEGETVLVGEVSKVNDDKIDNRFLEPVGRFPKIIEDEQPLHLLTMDY